MCTADRSMFFRIISFSFSFQNKVISSLFSILRSWSKVKLNLCKMFRIFSLNLLTVPKSAKYAANATISFDEEKTCLTKFISLNNRDCSTVMSLQRTGKRQLCVCILHSTCVTMLTHLYVLLYAATCLKSNNILHGTVL